MPPVNGFWSLTMYDADYFFVQNPLNRYTLSSRNKFKTNQDGSVDLYIQNDLAGQGQGVQLAAGAGRQVHPDAPVLLAQGSDHRRHLEAAGGDIDPAHAGLARTFHENFSASTR